MKLLVCFKIVADLDQLTPKDYVVEEKINIDTSFVKTTINCFDESGLEFGLRLSDEAEGLNLHIEKSALTIGNSQTELYLKSLNALCYDHTIRIDSGDYDIRFKPDAVGKAIVDYAEKNQQDLIIMGRQSSEGNNFSTPQVVAEQLGTGFIPNVVDIHMMDEHRLKITTDNNGNIYEQTVKTPVVVSVGNAVISKLRVPTLRDRMKYGSKEIEQFPLRLEDKSLAGKVRSLEYVDKSRSGQVIEQKGSEAVHVLYEDYLKRRLDNI
ncbi:MAG: electron transfer flavoprotein subunit beta/FixA family protein [Hespellia sp.]|nr:electron transfer flavoprotein subunit beta/FixA family protein [Hespellia sp.]